MKVYSCQGYVLPSYENRKGDFETVSKHRNETWTIYELTDDIKSSQAVAFGLTLILPMTCMSLAAIYQNPDQNDCKILAYGIVISISAFLCLCLFRGAYHNFLIFHRFFNTFIVNEDARSIDEDLWYQIAEFDNKANYIPKHSRKHWNDFSLSDVKNTFVESTWLCNSSEDASVELVEITNHYLTPLINLGARIVITKDEYAEDDYRVKMYFRPDAFKLKELIDISKYKNINDFYHFEISTSDNDQVGATIDMHRNRYYDKERNKIVFNGATSYTTNELVLNLHKKLKMCYKVYKELSL